MKRLLTITVAMILMAFACNKEAIEAPLVTDYASIPQPSQSLARKTDSAFLELCSRIVLSELQVERLKTVRQFREIKTHRVRASEPVNY